MSRNKNTRSLTRSVATVVAAVAFSMVLAAPVFAQSVTVKEDEPGLLKKAKVTAAAATATALAKVPGGKVEEVEIEKEDGKLIYSFTIKVAGKPGITEVGVDAMTGAVVNVEHEDAAAEAKEAKEDKAKADKAKAPAKAKAVVPPVKKP